ncbi:hypothetical protein ASD15_21915 [Massilia sp. Root351]|jgi:hypothetical protein|uniref:hypothetical protein n=1 Tax=Massilia sp. Root351 TaxID=1736522 RepID=UPI00070DB569|nr:hypothetical protein [Massilia sp. Root351]KQV78472.1 hypothetical protein ASD15_21915 [Massilia sp. Root351]
MAFKIAVTPTYMAKIVVELLNMHGKHEKSDFMAEFKRVSLDELDELRTLPQKEVLQKVLVGWSGLLDESNTSVPYNQMNFDVVLAIPQAFAALSEGFWASIFKAKEKN